MKTLLTTRVLASLGPGEYWDTAGAGLILRVGRNRRTFEYRWRSGGKNLRQRLGHYPSMSLAEARAAAREAASRIDSGTAPIPGRPHPRDAESLGALVDRYEAVRLSEGERTKHLSRRLRVLRRELAAYLSMSARSFAKADLRAARDAMIARGSPVQANRLVGITGIVLAWAAQEDLVEHNVAGDVRTSPERARDRVLSPAELRAIWAATYRLHGTTAEPYGRLIRFLLLTGQRRGEAASMRHADVLEGVWRIRAEATKSNRAHTVPLPALALAQLGTGAAHDLCFGGGSGDAIAGWHGAKDQLDKLAGVDGWRVHDLRRTCATGLGDLGIADHIVAAVLNHSLKGATGIYQRSQREAEKRQALDAWALAVARIVAAPAIVPLRAQA